VFKTYKERGLAVAGITVTFSLVRIAIDRTWDGFVSDMLWYTVPGLLMAYGVYTWDKPSKADEQQEAENSKN